jgi:hypothetical protein
MRSLPRLFVIASAAKQSIPQEEKEWIASSQVLLAMTKDGELCNEPEKPA